MAIPKVSQGDILKALQFIDENGVPHHNQSMRYFLLGENGKSYPPKYVIAVANHIANGAAIDTSDYKAIEAKNYLKNKGFTIYTGNQEKYELTITADQVVSTDECFDKDNLGLGDNFVPLGVYFQSTNGQTIKRNYAKGERRNSNQTMPRLAFQIYEKQLRALSVEEKENFPVCQYSPESGLIRGIFPSSEEYRKYHNSIEYLTYSYDNGRKFVIYSWNIFSTVVFVQECLKRFGEPGDRFVLMYREKQDKEQTKTEKPAAAAPPQPETAERVFNGYRNPYSDKLIESKNIIFRGAPGTGKTYLAREIAADIISDGYFDDYSLLTDEQKEQVEFVQFHPSYDYSDFVEGLRPKINADGSMGFELRDGIFKRFVERARKNYENSQKTQEIAEKEASAQESIADFFASVEFGVDTFETVNKNKFTITSADDEHIEIVIPGNAMVNKLRLNTDELRQMLESDATFTMVRDVTAFFGKKFATQAYSYDFALYKEIKKVSSPAPQRTVVPEKLKKYIFIIDEINRGEISKIFGELFFALDPGYRGPAGAVSTQYANLHTDPSKKFYIPENVYIIGTMNDIDKSVDSFDFAMRRRFRFIEIKADERLEMLASLDDELENEAIRRMTALNQEIIKTEELNENYQVGGSYFLKLKELTFDQLWTDYLSPLLQEYIRGMYDEAVIMNRFAQAYGYDETSQEVADEAAQS
ncbi:AAA family ATPase [Gemmiger formicilis]|uniref:McrB family protein n=1 Tax=Gemmiger formicilis TaxID=745368 RepID=UPI0019571B06|nr:AAA family ATPase [Gemmiger formicilis]MBM6914160.1 AAA family ATPase [Gemmiger formicilis]